MNFHNSSCTRNMIRLLTLLIEGLKGVKPEGKYY